MSGDFTQRAEPSFQDKSVRAANAVRSGADLVLELPFPYCSRSAQGFATAGIDLLSRSGTCTHFAFGSECGDLELLCELARIFNEGLFEKLRSCQKEQPDKSLMQLVTQYIKDAYGEQYSNVLLSPNDKLGIEYLRANALLEKPLTPVIIKRTVSRTENNGTFASSSIIRQKIRENLENGEVLGQDILDLMPSSSSFDLLTPDTQMFYKTLLISLSLAKPETLTGTEELPENFEKAVIEYASRATSYQELCKAISGKTFTDAKVRRMLLFAFFGVKSTFFENPLQYTYILAFSDKGRALLANSRKSRNIIATNRVSAIHKSKLASEQFALCQKARNTLKKCREHDGVQNV
jgi:predicted nucleotidyltransferase